MKLEQINTQAGKTGSNALLHGNCVELLAGMSSRTVDFVLTDPSYLFVLLRIYRTSARQR